MHITFPSEPIFFFFRLLFKEVESVIDYIVSDRRNLLGEPLAIAARFAAGGKTGARARTYASGNLAAAGYVEKDLRGLPRTQSSLEYALARRGRRPRSHLFANYLSCRCGHVGLHRARPGSHVASALGLRRLGGSQHDAAHRFR